MSIIYEPSGRALEYSLLACNLYTGCVHGCTYCYVPSALHISPELFHRPVAPKRDVLDQLRREAINLSGTDKRVLLCFTCDPYPPEPIIEKEKHVSIVTRRALEIFREFDIPFQVLTKGGTRAARDFDLYAPNDAFATTLTFSDPHQSCKYEPKAAMPSNRIAAIREAKFRGITTWVSLEPVLDPKQSLGLIRETADFVDLFKIGKLNHRASDIDWRAFGARAIALCEECGVPYYVKADLAKYLDGIEFNNTDTRQIERLATR